MTNTFLCVNETFFKSTFFLCFNTFSLKLVLNLSNYYIKRVFLFFLPSFFCILKVLVITIFIESNISFEKKFHYRLMLSSLCFEKHYFNHKNELLKLFKDRAHH